MRNTVGEGPAATTFVTTPSEPLVSTEETKLSLIIASEHKVVSQGSNFFADRPQIIYESQDAITGIAVHVARNLLFVADTTKVIYK